MQTPDRQFYARIYEAIDAAASHAPALPPGTENAIGLAVDRLRREPDARDRLQLAENASITLQRLRSALRADADGAEVSDLRRRLRGLADAWIADLPLTA